MEYIILYKNEFIVLLNNHEVAIPIEERTVSKNSEPNKDELIEKLLANQLLQAKNDLGKSIPK